MALTIEGASIGFDANEIQALLNDMNTKCIQDTISKMNTGMSDLRNAVDAGWVGASAEQFKKNMETDKETISNALNTAFEVLKEELNNIVAKMSEMDEGLIQARSNK